MHFRPRSIAFAIAALALSAGSVFAFSSMPTAATHGLQRAAAMAGKVVPVRAAATHEDPRADEGDRNDPAADQQGSGAADATADAPDAVDGPNDCRQPDD